MFDIIRSLVIYGIGIVLSLYGAFAVSVAAMIVMDMFGTPPSESFLPQLCVFVICFLVGLVLTVKVNRAF